MFLLGKIADGFKSLLALVKDQNEDTLGAASNGFRFHIDLNRPERHSKR